MCHTTSQRCPSFHSTFTTSGITKSASFICPFAWFNRAQKVGDSALMAWIRLTPYYWIQNFTAFGPNTLVLGYIKGCTPSRFCAKGERTNDVVASCSYWPSVVPLLDSTCRVWKESRTLRRSSYVKSIQNSSSFSFPTRTNLNGLGTPLPLSIRDLYDKV